MDTLITAKAKLDAGISLNTRSVDPHIWISGENQVPISLVNEDGERIRFAPMYVPKSGKGYGFPPNYGQPVKLTIDFETAYSVSSMDSLVLKFYLPEESYENTFRLVETGINTKSFVTEDSSFEVIVVSPEPSDGSIISKSVVPGMTKMSIRLRYIDEWVEMEIPVWRGPEINSRDFASDNRNYLASNTIFTPQSVSALDQTQFICKNSLICIQVKTESTSADSITAILKTGYEKKEVLCTKEGNNLYKSEPHIVVFPDYQGDSLLVGSKNYSVIHANPDSTKENDPFLYVFYKNQQSKAPLKKPMLAIFAYNPNWVNKEWIILHPSLHKFLGINNEEWFWETHFNDTVKLMKKDFSVTVDYCPLFEKFSPASSARDVEKYEFEKYQYFYMTGHSTKNASIEIYCSLQNYIDPDPPVLPLTGRIFFDPSIISSYFSSVSKQPDYKLVILNGCQTAVVNGETDCGEVWRASFNSECLVGWKEQIDGARAGTFMRRFFDYTTSRDSNYNPESVKTAIIEVKKSYWPEAPLRILPEVNH